jgi:hypothetical protein
MPKILVWDWPVRIGHWLMVGGFVLAWLTAKAKPSVWCMLFPAASCSPSPPSACPGASSVPLCPLRRFRRGPTAVKEYAGRQPAQAATGAPRRPQPGRRLGHRAAARPRHPERPFRLGDLQRHRRSLAGGTARRPGLGDADRRHRACRRRLSGSLLHGENLVRAMLTGRKQGLPDASHSIGPAARRCPAGLGRRRQLVDSKLIESGMRISCLSKTILNWATA